MHLLGVHQVVVVEDQQQLVLARLDGQLVDQGRHHPLKRGPQLAEQRGDPLADPRPRPVQRANHMPPEPHRVVVARVQRQPRHPAIARPDPVGQQHRLAEPGRGAHQDQPPGQPLAERPRQPLRRHEPRPRAGHMQLGGQAYASRSDAATPAEAAADSSAIGDLFPSGVRPQPASLLDADSLRAGAGHPAAGRARRRLPR